jgi:hypothetical protein
MSFLDDINRRAREQRRRYASWRRLVDVALGAARDRSVARKTIGVSLRGRAHDRLVEIQEHFGFVSKADAAEYVVHVGLLYLLDETKEFTKQWRGDDG